MRASEVPDALERRILEVLRKDGRASFRAVARLTSTTTPTVAARVRRMMETGLIRGFAVRTARTRASAETPQGPWVCAHCRDPIRGRARVGVVAGRHHAFCCRGCETEFVGRMKNLVRLSGLGDPRRPRARRP